MLLQPDGAGPKAATDKPGKAAGLRIIPILAPTL
jgi:hypothetical protein